MRTLSTLTLLLLATAVATAAAGPRTRIAEGNAHYAAGRYAEALECYEQAAAGDTAAAPELLHNRAAALFKLGRTAEARALWEQLLATADVPTEAATRYNLGNCAYADALAAGREGQPQAALPPLEQAAEQYRAALRLDPTFADARANLELAQLLRRQLEQQMQEQPQAGGPASQPQDRPPDSQPAPASQPAPGRPQQSDGAESDSPPPQSAAPQAGEAAEQAPQPAEPSARESAEPAPPQEQGATEEPKQPADGPAPGEREPPPETQAAGADAGDGRPVPLTREQAERLLQIVRDAEKARREMLARQRAAQQKPVERDW